MVFSTSESECDYQSNEEDVEYLYIHVDVDQRLLPTKGKYNFTHFI